MLSKCSFYIDESGTKHPDHSTPSTASHKHDWFAFGGILINDEDIPTANSQIDSFFERWPQIAGSPLHSSEIRGAHKNFTWLKKDSEIRAQFLADLEVLVTTLPIIGLTCVVDRNGYNTRYREKHADNRWMLCKTAFAVVVERAPKYAQSKDRKLRVFVEQSSKKDDQILEQYYKTLKSDGHWFDEKNASKYTPLKAEDYRETLYEFRCKTKASKLMQIADLYLWPMCMSGYDKNNKPYKKLLKAGKLMDCLIQESEKLERGIKYSCF